MLPLHWGRGILTVCRFRDMLPMDGGGVSSQCVGLEVCYQGMGRGILTVCRFRGMLPMDVGGVSTQCVVLEVCYQWTGGGVSS